MFGLRCICSKFICDSMQWKKNAAGECGTQKNRDCGAVTFDRVSSILYRAAGGIFAEEGLDVEVIQATGGSHVTSVMSGDAWGVIGGVDSNAIPNASGNCPDPVIAVCNCVNRANVYLCAAVGEEYTGNTDEELAQYFKGKKINSGRFGGSPNLCVRYLLLSIGLDPDKDVVMVEPADMSTSVAVVQSGQADISWAAEPQIVDGMKSGVWTDAFYQFTDLGDYAYSVLSVSQSTIRNDPETVQNFVNAMLKSLSAAQDKKLRSALPERNFQPHRPKTLKQRSTVPIKMDSGVSMESSHRRR